MTSERDMFETYQILVSSGMIPVAVAFVSVACSVYPAAITY